MRREDKEIQKIKDRFEHVEGQEQLFEYAVPGIKEKFIIKVIDTNPGKEDATIRITPLIYKGYGKPTVLDLPLSEISPQFDLKNTLVNELIEALKEFKKSLFNTPIDKPGIQHYIMLKLAFLLDMPGICVLFLKGAIEKDFAEYRLSPDDRVNALRTNIFSHNIGGFLRDKKVRAIMEDMGREEELDKWYEYLAEERLNFLIFKSNHLPQKATENDFNKLRVWFFQRYNLIAGWKATARSLKFSLVWIVLMAASLILFVIGLLRNNYLLIFSPVLFSIGLSFLWLLLHKSLSRLFEMFVPRLLFGIIVGSLLFVFTEEIWRFILSKTHFSSLKVFGFIIFAFALVGMFLYTKMANREWGTRKERFWRVAQVLLFSTFLCLIPILFISFFNTQFMKEIVCEHSDTNLRVLHCFLSLGSTQFEGERFVILFWVAFSILAGFFFQLIWQEKEITEPI